MISCFAVNIGLVFEKSIGNTAQEQIFIFLFFFSNSLIFDIYSSDDTEEEEEEEEEGNAEEVEAVKLEVFFKR